ncbi:hypothetical protein GCM10022224_019050 [Nonomuraea antimicrobica]|uniref:Uncharacterized protein n=1 Tax=Nonomuraea antimicrobica TaxID=561173 RepID=A0ABP7BEF3_9ACTN
MTELTDMSERKYFNQFAKRTGMFIGRPSLKGVTAFLIGYDQAARRHGGPGLDGWREWLMARYQVGTNLVWEAQIQQIALGETGVRPDLTPEEETQVTGVLFDLLDKFLADQERALQGPQT